MFTEVSAVKSGIAFQNKVENKSHFNILYYLYFYNGGGVAIGDINNDGLIDLFFTGMQVPNKLYLIILPELSLNILFQGPVALPEVNFQMHKCL